MKISRRQFLKLSGVAAIAAVAAAKLGCEPGQPENIEELNIKYEKEISTICPYCGCGCGAICCVDSSGEVVAVIGDPDHPINEGALCSKGSAMLNLRNVYDQETGELVLNPNRVTKVLYRAPYSDAWEEKSWEWTLGEIAKRVKETRDATFETVDSNGVTVNRTTAIAHLGSAAIDNEENYLMVKLQRALGLINIDHHARL